MKKSVCLSFVCFSFLLLSNIAQAEGNTNVYVTNNNINNNIIRVPSQSNIMCTRKNGFCTNGYYIMGTQRAVYAPTRSRLKAARAQKLGLNSELY